MKKLLMRNRQLQRSSFLMHSLCIVLRKLNKMPNKSASLMQLSPDVRSSIFYLWFMFQAPPPVMLRASMIKSQISDIETLKFKLDGKEEAIKDLKRQIKLKVLSYTTHSPISTHCIVDIKRSTYLLWHITAEKWILC